MGVFGFSFEMESSVSATKMFKASALESHILLPKAVSQFKSSAQIVDGDGEFGSVEHFKFTEVLQEDHLKERIDVLDRDNLEYKYTVIEGGNIGTKPTSAIYHTRFEPSEEGGCVIEASAEYNTINGEEYTKEEINARKDEMMGKYKLVEAYVLANTDYYA
ncbi:major allergen Pru ar 1-like [Tasmannia lanceolata]|uniref:major allergen Pru ar 1-like n=1 Tax=Tasmannia lanceolata TaxID=3420 RepID=UPI004062EC41